MTTQSPSPLVSLSFFSMNSALRRQQPPFYFHCRVNIRRFSRLEKIRTRFSKDDELFQLEYEGKMEKGQKLISQLFQEDTNLHVLEVIDAMQRLGVDHHFQELIGLTLQQQYHKTKLVSIYHFDTNNNDLYETSLRFRVLRQHGYYIPADVFRKFTNSEGKFKEELRKDIKGLMALHEASHLSMEGEDILEEGARFSNESLRLFTNDDRQAIMAVQSTLTYPHHKSLPIFTSKMYIENMMMRGENNEWEAFLVNLATLDHKITKSLYQQEVRQILQWWKELGLMEELAKKQQLKWYIWSVGAIPNPQLSRERVELTKPIALVYLIDDIIDVHCTFDQIVQFAKAINRWEMPADDDGLPSYVKICLVALFDTIEGICDLVMEKYGWNPIDHLKQAWKNQFEAYLTEARWFAKGESPTSDEYLRISIITTGVPMSLITLFYLLGHDPSSTQITSVEPIITSAGAILRLLDDLDGTMGEKQEGNDASYVDYYVREHKNVTFNEGKQRVIDMVSEQWKLLNKQCMFSSSSSNNTHQIQESFRKGCLNLARIVPMIYNYSDTHCLDQIMSMFSTTVDDDKFDVYGEKIIHFIESNKELVTRLPAII